MSGSSMVKVKADIDLKRLEKKFSYKNLQRARFAMSNQMLADMNKFVPKDQGFLRQTGHASADGKHLIWRTVYAKAMFYGSRPFRRGMPINVFMWSNNRPTTPGTGKRWDLKAKRRYAGTWRTAYARGMRL